MRIRFFLLGRMEFQTIRQRCPVGLTEASARLLAYLVVYAGAWKSREEICDQLWPDIDRVTGLNRLSSTFWRLRKEIDDADIDTEQFLHHNIDWIKFDPIPQVWVDATFMELRLKKILENMGEVPLPLLDLRKIERGLALYRGSFCQALDDGWISIPREYYRALYIDCLAHAARSALAVGYAEKALGFARHGANTEPLREDFHRLIMKCHLAMGNRALAIRRYNNCEKYLAAEIGVSPTAETKALLDKPPPFHRPFPLRDRRRSAPSDLQLAVTRLETLLAGLADKTNISSRH